MRQTGLIGTLQEARPQYRMDFDGRPDDQASDPVRANCHRYCIPQPSVFLCDLRG